MKKFYALALSALVAISAMAAPQLKGKMSESQRAARTNVVNKMKVGASHEMRTLKASSSAALKAPKKVDAPDDIIFDAEGEHIFSKNHAAGFFNTFFGISYGIGDNPSEVIWGDNGDVYIRDICSFLQSGVYVKGTYADGKVTVELPQIGYYEPEDEEYEEFYAYVTVCELCEMEEDGETYQSYKAAPEEMCTITYTVGDDRSLTLELNDPAYAEDENNLPQYIIGLVEDPTPDVATWYGYGDAYQSIEAFDLDPVTVPEGVDLEQWAVTSGNGSGLCYVGFDGNDVYIKGAIDFLPDCVFKGEVKDNTVVFPGGQFMGVEYGTFIYFIPVEWTSVDWEDFAVLDEVVMNYDAENKVMAVDNELIDLLFISSIDDDAPLDYLENPTFRYQSDDDTNAAPQDPYVNYFEEYSSHSWGDEGYIDWTIPNINVNGFLLDTSRLYYHLLADGEVMTLTVDEYPLFDEDVTDIPWDFGDDYDLQVSDDSRYFTFKSPDIKTYGCQSFYLGTDGETYASNLVTFTPESDGIEGINNLKQIKSVEVYNLHGQRVDNAGKGVSIIRYRYTDGTTSTSKVVK